MNTFNLEGRSLNEWKNVNSEIIEPMMSYSVLQIELP